MARSEGSINGTANGTTTPQVGDGLLELQPTVWSQVCQILERRLGGDNFLRCFSGTSAALLDDGHFVITVPNPIHQLWIESNHSAAVADAVAEVTGVPAVIEFRVASESTPPVVNAAFAPMPETKAARANGADQPIRFFSEAGLNAKFNSPSKNL